MPARRPRSAFRAVEAAQVELLEDRTLLSIDAALPGVVAMTQSEFGPTVASTDGGGIDIPRERPNAALAAPSSEAPPFPLEDTFRLHSNAGADKTIYLDFDGHTTTGTLWNGGGNPESFTSRAWSLDGDRTTFNDAELEVIQQIYRRVADDFAPFTVDVTTEATDVERLRRSGNGDEQWGIRVVITPDDLPGPGAGGVAYLGSFQFDTDTPAFVFNVGEVGVAEAASHEVGHALGLNHDGRITPEEEYYSGHGVGPTSWAPIMGVGYSVGVSQWSKGEYPGASNTEDDLRIITDPAMNGAGWGYSGLNYRADAVGDVDSAATALTVVGGDLSGAGVIETREDIDVFSFTTGGGQVTLDVAASGRGGNLDVLAQLYNSSGVIVAQDNPRDSLDARLAGDLAAGRYFLRIQGVGKPAVGDDFGYTDYGSLGAYTIVGTRNVGGGDDNYEENDVLAIAADPLNNGGHWADRPLSEIDGPGIARDDDFYLVDVGPSGGRFTADLTFSAAGGDLDIELLDPRGDVVAAGRRTGSNEHLDVQLFDDGVHYLRIFPKQPGANTYDLVWSIDDVYEENDTRATAADPLFNGGDWGGRPLSTIAGRGVANDDDFYRIDVAPAGGLFTADLTFVNADGDLDLELLNAEGNRVARSAGITDNERIETTLSGGGTYYLRVSPYFNTGNRYDLAWNLDDRYEQNDTPATAADPLTNGGSWAGRPLSQIAGRGVAIDDDYYLVSVSRGGGQFVAELGFDGGGLAFELLGPNRNVVARGVETTGGRRIAARLNEGGLYLLHVAPQVGVGVRYDLSWALTPPPTVSVKVAPAEVVEDGSRNLVFTFTRTGDLSAALTVDFTVGGTARRGNDYALPGPAAGTTSRVTFAAEWAMATRVVDPIADGVVEPHETVVVTLVEGAGYILPTGGSRTVGTIRNDEAAEIAVSDARVLEGPDGQTRYLEFTVALSRPVDTPVAVTYLTQAGTAKAGQDFRETGGRFTFNPGGSTTRRVLVAVFGDDVVERDETLALRLSALGNPGDRAVAIGSSGLGTIVNDDAALVTVTHSRETEGPDDARRSLKFTISVDRPIDAPITLTFLTDDGTARAGVDYRRTGGRFTFNPGGVTTRTVRVAMYGDDVVERDESLTLRLSNLANPGDRAVALGPSGHGTIVNDDAAAVTVSNAMAAEGGPGQTRYLNFRITLSHPVDAPVSVTYLTFDGSAAAGSDYRRTGGRVTFNPGGSTTRLIRVAVYGDATAERDETMSLRLSALSNDGRAVAIGRSGVGTILNDDTTAADALFAAGLADTLV